MSQLDREVATGRSSLVRLILLGLVLLILLLQIDQPQSPSSRLMSVSARHSFSIVGWQVRALAGSLVRIVAPPRVPVDVSERVARVETYYALMSEVSAARRARDEQFNLPAGLRDED
ncbi:MAG TPA: hypothetical protein VMP10_02905, partial [Chloroflexota bacterium]|nr:hypothetical protein [Chloroflexota bacterium]